VFDLAVARLLFQHLADPGAAAREMFRILRPGGWAAVIDADDDLALLIDPEPPGFRELMGRFARAQEERGGDRRVGRRLLRRLRGAVFVDGRFEIIALHSDELGKAAFASQLDPGLMRPLVAAGVLTQEQVSAVEAGMRSLLEDEKTILLMSRVFAAGRKPL
jgi:SAM-dependent methyltransferase